MHSANIQKRTCKPLILLTSLSLASPILSAETPTPETLRAFESYVQAAEARGNEELAARKNFLWVDALPERERERTYQLLKRQQTIIRHSASCASRELLQHPRRTYP